MGQPLSTLRELLVAIPDTLKSLPGTVKESLPDTFKGIPEKVKALPGAVMVLPTKLLAYPEAVMERLKALLPDSLKSLPGRLKKEDIKVPEITSDVQANKTVPTEIIPTVKVPMKTVTTEIMPTESITPEETETSYLQMALDVRSEAIEDLDETFPVSVVQSMKDIDDSSWQVGYINIFFAAATYYNMVTMRPASFSDFLKLRYDWPTHFMWGSSYGACACLAASLFPPYTKWAITILVGLKWCSEVIKMFVRSQGWLDADDPVEDDIDDDDL